MVVIPFPKASKPIADAAAPVLDRERRPTVDNRGVQQAVGNLAKAGKMPELPMSLAEPYTALGSVGKAINQAGNLVGALAIKRREAETDVQIAEADVTMDRTLSEFEQWKISTNAEPSTWEPELQKRLSGARETVFGNENLHPAAREQIGLRLQRFEGQAQTHVALGATKETFNRARSVWVAGIDNATEAQDPEKLNGLLMSGAEKGYFHPHEIEAARQRYNKVGEQKTKQAEADKERAESEWVVSEAISDPVAWKQNNPEPWKGKELLWQRGKNAADQREREGSAEAVGQISDAIVSGDLTVPAEIEAWESPFLTPALREQAKRFLVNRDAFAEQQDREKNGTRNAVELRKEIKDYEPEQDPDRLQFFELQQRIGARVPGELAGELSSELGQKYGLPARGKPRPEINRNVTQTLETIFDAKGGVIPWRKEVPVLDSKGKPVKDYNGNPKTELQDDLAAKQRAIDAQSVIETKMAEWFEQNPGATIPEARKKLNEVLPEGTEAAFFLNMKKKSADAGGIGKVTSYGYANDSTPDRNSSVGIGAWVPDTEAAKIKRGEPSEYRLREGDIAVSPDIEKAFKSAGVKPGGSVMVQLANGEVRQVRWMDRTAQDSDITSGRIKGVSQPLRGRFDFYSPSGRHPNDGMAVVNWWKPGQEVAKR